MPINRLGCENCAAPYIVEYIQTQKAILEGLKQNQVLGGSNSELELQIAQTKRNINSRKHPLTSAQASCKHCPLKVDFIQIIYQQ